MYARQRSSYQGVIVFGAQSNTCLAKGKVADEE